MAEISKFFNSAPGDPRTYQASDFADYFGSVLSTGLLHTDNIPALEVKCEGTDLRTYVTPGKAIMQGYLYENTSNLYLEHALPEPTLDRIDRIVLRLDKRNQSRFIKLFVKQGTASSNPVPPNLQRDDFIYELSLAQIRVRANTSTLNPADLIDERLDENLCGLVHSLISIPTSQFQQQWDEFMAGIQDEGFASAEEFNAHLADTATGAHKAKNIAVEDLNNRFTATDVEGVLNELFTFANDGKTSIASVIGSPATSGDTFTTLANHITNHKSSLANSLGSGSSADSLQTLVNTRLQGLKNTLATNLTNKGQTAKGTETLLSLINKVAAINTGKRFATGTVTQVLNQPIAVSGLSFTPSVIIIQADSHDNYPYYVKVYFGTNAGGYDYSDETTHIYFGSQMVTGKADSRFIGSGLITNQFTISPNGFSVQKLHTDTSVRTIKWIAFE